MSKKLTVTPDTIEYSTTQALEAERTRITLYWSESLQTWVTIPQAGANKMFITLPPDRAAASNSPKGTRSVVINLADGRNER